MAMNEHLTGAERQTAMDQALDAFKAMEPGHLLLQDALLRGAIDVLNALLARGCEPAVAQVMLNDSLLTLGMVHGVAQKRGIKLPALVLMPVRLNS